MGRLVTLILAIALFLVILASCQGNDPFGATTREEIRGRTAIKTTELETQSDIKQADIAAQASMENTRVWAGVFPIIAVIFVGGVLAGIVFYYQGKLALLRAQNCYTPRLPSPTIERPGAEKILHEYATRDNLRLLEKSDESYLFENKLTGAIVRIKPKA